MARRRIWATNAFVFVIAATIASMQLKGHRQLGTRLLARTPLVPISRLVGAFDNGVRYSLAVTSTLRPSPNIYHLGRVPI
jgi:hypothetical protein